MASVSPIEATDLNGCAINPSDIISDDLIGYCSYVKNLCTELGTKNDTEEGYQSFLDFQKEIQAAKISTFEPDDIQTDDNFQKIDLTGESAEVAVLPMSMYMGVNMQMLMANGGGYGFTPFDQTENKSYLFKGNGCTPFDVTGSNAAINTDNVVLSA